MTNDEYDRAFIASLEAEFEPEAASLRAQLQAAGEEIARLEKRLRDLEAHAVNEGSTPIVTVKPLTGRAMSFQTVTPHGAAQAIAAIESERDTALAELSAERAKTEDTRKEWTKRYFEDTDAYRKECGLRALHEVSCCDELNAERTAHAETKRRGDKLLTTHLEDLARLDSEQEAHAETKAKLEAAKASVVVLNAALVQLTDAVNGVATHLPDGEYKGLGDLRVALRAGLAAVFDTAAAAQAKLQSARREALEEAAQMFEGLGWLCMDHGGEEAEAIASRIRALAGDKSNG